MLPLKLVCNVFAFFCNFLQRHFCKSKKKIVWGILKKQGFFVLRNTKKKCAIPYKAFEGGKMFYKELNNQ